MLEHIYLAAIFIGSVAAFAAIAAHAQRQADREAAEHRARARAELAAYLEARAIDRAAHAARMARPIGLSVAR